MALTIAITSKAIEGNQMVRRGTIAFDSSYPTGGEAFVYNDFDLRRLTLLALEIKSGYMFEPDYTNKKIKVFNPRAAITDSLAISGHAAGSTSVTSSSATMPAHTLSGVAGVSAGAGAEVANATDLSALTNVCFTAYGV